MSTQPRNDPSPSPAGANPFAPARWSALARAVGVAVDEPVAIALSGGADSVYLLHVVAASKPRPRVLAIHVDHALRGAESERDALFATELCARLRIPFTRVAAPLAHTGPSLEARAREVRYRALCKAAREARIGVIATGHHQDDALETLLQRWIRGTALEGLSALEPRLKVTRGLSATPRVRAHERYDDGAGEIVIVRPLLAQRREEVRRALRANGITWCEDSSNSDLCFTRNRVRRALVPRLEELGGAHALENLRAFGNAVEELEERCAALTSTLMWSAPVHAAARRGKDDADWGGSIARAELMRLARPLQRRALWRLLTEGAGASPSRASLERIVDDLAAGRCAVHALPRGWSLRLRSKALWLEPPHTELDRTARLQLALYDGSRSETEQRLAVPGSVVFPDGRAITAEVVEIHGSAAVPRSPLACELDYAALEGPLVVRFARPGDRFHGIGAPGSKPLARFMSDAGVPREGRARVPLVLSGTEVVWVAGIRPCQRARVSARTERRLVLQLVHPTAEAALRAKRRDEPALPFERG